MRAGLSTIQQTLTAEAAAVLTQSIAEAARRGHGQTTPLHVAATLLAAPSSLLRHACIRSHPHSSHPLQCRALELCFSVALDRLPSSNPTPVRPPGSSSSSSSGVAEPPISNALMAALKRAQAHQRRGCPESQQQPLLAVKVELEQLVVSILDDPSVSRVMREASFSSTAVKATIEQSISSATAASSPTAAPSPAAAAALNNPSPGSLGSGLSLVHRNPARNLYINPRLHQPHQTNGGAGGRDPHSAEEVKRVTDILLRSKKRNPVLVGDSDPDALMREALKKIEAGDVPPPLRTAKVVSLEKEFAAAAAAADRSQIPAKIRELGSLVEADAEGGGVVIDLGDLKWLVESPGGFGASPPGQSGPIQPQPIVSEVGKAAVSEMGKLVKRFGDGGRHAWLVGTATCATYLRCQVYHPTMENDWDLQAVPIARRLPLATMFPRLASNGILSSSVETLSPMKGFAAMGAAAVPLRLRPESADVPPRRTTLCPACMESYERELAKLVAKEFEKSSPKPERNQALPQWLQIAKPGNGDRAKSSTDQLQSRDQELMWKQSSDELLKRWRDTCSRLHPSFHSVLLGPERPLSSSLSLPSSMLAPRRPYEPRLALARSLSPLPLSSNQENGTKEHSSVEQPRSPPASPVRTDLALGLSKGSDSSVGKTHKERLRDFADCTQDEYSDRQRATKAAGVSDVDSFKQLFGGLTEKVSWQPEAAAAVATVVTQCKSGNGKQRRFAPKGDAWLLFVGPDRAGKRKMATALSELVFGTALVTVSFSGGSSADGDNGESNVINRGKTSLDRVVEAVRRNPFSVVLLEDVDRADGLVRGTVRRAIESGRLPDSHGREVSLGSVIFILTSDWLPEELKSSHDSLQHEEKILDSVSCGWHLELSVEDKPAKRPAGWLCGYDQPTKARKGLAGSGGLSLDLNLAAGLEDEAGEGSRNSSDLTVEHEQEKGRLDTRCSTLSPASELAELVDDCVVFKPLDLRPLKQKVLESISAKFDAVMGNGRSIRIDEDALDRMVGSLCLSTGASSSGWLEEWAETVLVPSIKQFRGNLRVDNGAKTVRLSVAKGSPVLRSNGGNSLPPMVAIAIDGL